MTTDYLRLSEQSRPYPERTGTRVCCIVREYQEFNGLHESLVDEATVQVAARILEERGESQALKRGHPADYLLSGVVRCGLCNRAFIGTSAKGRSKLYHYYTCSTRYRYGVRRSIDRYFAAFEEGSMSPATCQKRPVPVKWRPCRCRQGGGHIANATASYMLEASTRVPEFTS